MATKKPTKKAGTLSDSQKIGIGASLAAAALATAAGTYFLYGSKKADQNRKSVKSWMLKAKAEVLEGIEKVEEMSKKDYETLIKTVSGTYAALQDVSKRDIADFTREMKEHWEGMAKTAIKETKKAAKAPAKKAPTKAAAKKALAKKAAK